mmetsp:Transcript_21271/g.47661  ORF Transcript_21271/g.47661 Transcript_21271/m.47661 type:complete len:326 (-) Transcript_21271:57-1034(-)
MNDGSPLPSPHALSPTESDPDWDSIPIRADASSSSSESEAEVHWRRRLPKPPSPADVPTPPPGALEPSKLADPQDRSTMDPEDVKVVMTSTSTEPSTTRTLPIAAPKVSARFKAVGHSALFSKQPPRIVGSPAHPEQRASVRPSTAASVRPSKAASKAASVRPSTAAVIKTVGMVRQSSGSVSRQVGARSSQSGAVHVPPPAKLSRTSSLASRPSFQPMPSKAIGASRPLFKAMPSQAIGAGSRPTKPVAVTKARPACKARPAVPPRTGARRRKLRRLKTSVLLEGMLYPKPGLYGEGHQGLGAPAPSQSRSRPLRQPFAPGEHG